MYHFATVKGTGSHLGDSGVMGGMRGLKSILVASGALKRKYGDSLSEKSIALKGFLEVPRRQPNLVAE